MFTVKLATGVTFSATAAEQMRTQIDGNSQARIALRVESTPAQHELDWYLERLDAPGALDSVQLLCENGTVGLEVQGYTHVVNATIRLLVTGEKSFSIMLAKPLVGES